jgi:hypothetical protein
MLDRAFIDLTHPTDLQLPTRDVLPARVTAVAVCTVASQSRAAAASRADNAALNSDDPDGAATSIEATICSSSRSAVPARHSLQRSETTGPLPRSVCA